MRAPAKNVGDLRRLTNDCNVKMPILVPFAGHGYREADVQLGKAIRHPDGSWSEDYGELNPEEWSTDGSKRYDVLTVI